jgi:hypothetical protein
MKIKSADRGDLKRAKLLLENPGLAAKIADALGTPIEKGFEKLPEKWNSMIGDLTQTALTKAVQVAVFTIEDTPDADKSNWWHKLAVATSGGVGGFYGLPGFAIELPISTTIMLRSISDVARSEGESINTIEAQLACVEVFALGGQNNSDDAAESGYFAVRTALSRSLTKAAEYIAEKGAAEEAASALVRLIIRIAERFSLQVTEKAAAQLIPVLGAFGGAIINTLFIDHFQDMAHGHFIVRRLERKYGEDLVKKTYLEI